MAEVQKKNSYGDEAIQQLTPREHVRRRPSMYVGTPGDGSDRDDALYVLVKEVVDNGIDEFIMGYGKTLEIKLENNRVSVRDYGRGIPLNSLDSVVSQINTGAKYVVTQMFFDNQKYFDFVKRCREAGITVPIIPGIKPLTSLTQQVLLPKTFHIDLPMELADALRKCKSNDEVKALGVEWAIAQARELKAANVPSIHFYSMNAAAGVEAIAKAVY
jgi:hypothetical protein